MVTPSEPEARKRKKAHKVKIELPGPGHGCHIAQKNWEQVPAMIEDHNTCKTGDANNENDQQNSKCTHMLSPFKIS
jgi:hypothetical protein